MKILLDECLPQDVCKSFVDHECRAARAASFGGKKNGELLTLAEQAGFDVLVGVDNNIPYQQNVRGRTIAVLIIRLRWRVVHSARFVGYGQGRGKRSSPMVKAVSKCLYRCAKEGCS
jgi:hypothetical protein